MKKRLDGNKLGADITNGKTVSVQMDGERKSHTSPTHTREQRAKMAGVGTGTVARFSKVMNSNDEERNQTVRKVLSDTAGVSEDTYSKVKDIVFRKLNKVKKLKGG